MKRRKFFRNAGTALGGVAAFGLAPSAGEARAAPGPAVEMDRYRFKLGMYLPELQLPFDEALATAKEIGVESVWFNRLKDEVDVARMTDARGGPHGAAGSSATVWKSSC